jgi:VWFA-related protein
LVLGILAVGIAALSGNPRLAARSTQPVPVFRASVDLVPISAVVRDGRGRLVTTLTAADFEVLDKGEKRRIVDFQIDDTSALTLAVLVDVSGSMRMGPKMAFARDALNRLGAEVQPARDDVSLFTFDSELHEQPRSPLGASALQAALTTEPFGTTSLYDAIAATARRLEGRPSPRRAIVVITDGVDTSSTLTPGEVSALASSIDVPVYVIVTVSSIDRPLDDRTPRTPRPTADLRDLAHWTGGDLVWVTAEADAALGTRRIMSELRHQYLLAIESATEAEWRPIDVRVRNRRLTIRARSGYFSRGKAS